MNNWDLYTLLHIVANKDVRSNWLSPSDFSKELEAQNIRVYSDLLGLRQRYRPGTMQSGSGASRKIDGDLSPFQEIQLLPVASQEVTVTDWYYIDDFYTENSIFPEIISKQELGTRLNSPTKTPNEKYPVGIVTEKGLKLWPASVTSATVIWYRNLKKPVFSTTVNPTTGLLQYNPSLSVELEWRDDVKLDVLALIAQDMGVNIEKQDLAALAQKQVESGK